MVSLTLRNLTIREEIPTDCAYTDGSRYDGLTAAPRVQLPREICHSDGCTNVGDSENGGGSGNRQ